MNVALFVTIIGFHDAIKASAHLVWGKKSIQFPIRAKVIVRENRRGIQHCYMQLPDRLSLISADWFDYLKK